MEREPVRRPEGVRVPRALSPALLLAGTAMTAFSLVRNDGATGALIAVGGLGLGVGIAHVVARRAR